jgi:5-carboxymethyl-2-hydroxymuconate isomerase
MPHIVVEYSSNLGSEAEVKALLVKINASLIAERGASGLLFPKAGIRSRAIAIDDWCIADGATADDAFVHLTVRIARGRTDEQKRKAFDAVFEIVKAHFAAAYAKRGLALSMDVDEFTNPTWKHSNLHARLAAAA